ncbi:ABC transporter ATP-binding protein [Lentilactobacillus kisonensis]|uniref:Ferrichrome ABC transporter, ATP-binding protein FhuC n=2 Tax=Lentilactobacillus kisonensis TaxID=481722 RepID=A0A0R1NK69_9LACO|nr:ABC transporter ATP-binding protein [Lentilactobacillus kisonensis]EHO49555.1 putative ferrichrome ABC transporter, ATP-binding protein FhuC [Lentilactobacillus kisonensis F0435]KRL20797.1 ferrichrome ABC transporter, ATP-binding protein FhuC [Lentilactobacillus kisonensis DSM 19906 = JCM 15041]
MELNQVSFRYPKHQTVLHDISVEAPKGKIISIIGPNGSGKSTILKLLAGILTPTVGQVTLDNQSINTFSRKQLASKLAIVSQKNDLYDEIKVIDVVKTGRLPYHKLLDVISDEEVTQYLAMTNLSELAQRPMTSLSGGQQQRVWLASALAQEPEYLLLDEPTTYLDIHYQTDLMAILKQLHEREQITIVMVLHDINQAFKISDELWLIKDGKLVAEGSPEKCYDSELLGAVFEARMQIVTVPHYGRYIVEIPGK